MNEEVVVTALRPCCLHLNNLMTYGTGTAWIRPQQQVLGSIPDYMDHFQQVAPFFTKDGIMSRDEDIAQPQGPEVLWQSTTLRFRFTGWVERKHLKILIVQQKIGKEMPDPWRTKANETEHSHYLPYTLTQFRSMAGPFAPNWLDKSQYRVIAQKSVYLNSVPEIPPHSVLHQTADAVADMAGITQHETGREATTGPVRYCNITIKPNMVIKQLVTSMNEDGTENQTFSANPREDKTEGPYSYDNINPRQNLWAIVMSDDDGHDTLTPNHRTTFTCERYNRFRDESNTRVKTVKAAFDPGDISVRTLMADGTEVDHNGRIVPVPPDLIPFEGGGVERSTITDWLAYYQAQAAYYANDTSTGQAAFDAIPHFVYMDTPNVDDTIHGPWEYYGPASYYTLHVQKGPVTVAVP